MRISGNPQMAVTNGVATDTVQAKRGSRFSKVLNQEKPGKSLGHDPPSPADPEAGPPALMAPLASRDVAPVEGGRGVASSSDVLLASLVQEIATEAPPGGVSSVDMQFDSHTLQGLHVRVEKTGVRLEVHFSTASEAVTRLLTANADRLTEALVQRGYVAPAVSVQKTESSVAVSAGDFRRSSREGGNRGGREQGGSQKRG